MARAGFLAGPASEPILRCATPLSSASFAADGTSGAARRDRGGRRTSKVKREGTAESSRQSTRFSPRLGDELGAGYSPASGSRSPRAGLAASLPAPPDVLLDGCSGDPAAELRERRELIRWAEDLYREVAKLEEDRAALHRQLEESRRRCAELDRLCRSDRSGSTAACENGELRKQLAAYAVEIDVLREENRSATQALYNANEEMQRLAGERDDLRHMLHSGGAGEVVLSLTVSNVSAPRLRALSGGLLAAFETRVRQAIADDARACGGLRVTPDLVSVDLLESGVVQLEAVVALPHGVGAEELSARLNTSQTLARGIATSLEALQEIEAVREGPIGVHSVSVMHRDTESLHEVRRHRDSLRGSHDALLQAHSELQSDHQELIQQHDEERRQREDLEKRLGANQEELDVRLRQGHEQRQKDRQHLAMTHSLKENFAVVVRDLFRMLEDLQESYVAQTRHYEQLAMRVRSQEAEHSRNMKEAEAVSQDQTRFLSSLREHLQRARKHSQDKEAEIQYYTQAAERYEHTAKTLYSENHQAAEQVRLHQQRVATFNELEQQRQERDLLEERGRGERRRERHRAVNNPNIAKSMALALDGIVVRKAVGVAPDKNGRLEQRKLRVDITKGQLGEPRFMLRWAKEPYKTWSDKSACDLERVVVLGYGHSARVPKLYPNDKEVVPWRCFSVFTARRSFDFLCQSDEDAQTFMLVLSRLCHRVQGWSVLGQVPTRARFLVAQGWCKVETSCRNRRATLYTHLKDALHTTVESGAARATPRPAGSRSPRSLDPCLPESLAGTRTLGAPLASTGTGLRLPLPTQEPWRSSTSVGEMSFDAGATSGGVRFSP